MYQRAVLEQGFTPAEASIRTRRREGWWRSQAAHGCRAARKGRRFSTASGPLLGPFVSWIVSSIGVIGTFLLRATTLRSGAGPSLRTSSGPHMNTSL